MMIALSKQGGHWTPARLLDSLIPILSCTHLVSSMPSFAKQLQTDSCVYRLWSLVRSFSKIGLLIFGIVLVLCFSGFRKPEKMLFVEMFPLLFLANISGPIQWSSQKFVSVRPLWNKNSNNSQALTMSHPTPSWWLLAMRQWLVHCGIKYKE